MQINSSFSVRRKFRLTAVAAALVVLVPGIAATASAETPDSWVWNTDTAPDVPSGQIGFTGTDIAGHYKGVIVQDPASGSLSNLVLDIAAIGPKDGVKQDNQIIGVEVQGGTPDFSGDSMKIAVQTDFVGSGNNQAAAFNFNSGSDATISAKEVDLSVTSKAENGKSVYGVETGGGGTLSITSDVVNIHLDTATERPTGNYSEAIGVDVYGGKLVTGESTVLNVTGVSHAAEPTTNGTDNASSVYGLKFEGGQGEIGGTAHIDVSANGGNAIGVGVTNYFYNTSLGENFNDSAATVNNLTVNASSLSGKAAGIDAAYTAGQENTVILETRGDSVLEATTETGKAYGINVTGNTTVAVRGDLAATATATGSGEAYSVYASEGTLALAGDTNTLNGNAAVVDGGTLNLINVSGKSQTEMNGNVSVDAGSTIGLENATLNLGAGKTVDVAGTMNSENGTIVIHDAPSDTPAVAIARLNNREGTTILTGSATAGQIAIGKNTGEGLNVVLASGATDQLGSNPEEAKKAMSAVVDVGESDSGYAVNALEGVLVGSSSLALNADGTVASYTERKNSGTDALQKIGAMNFLTFRSQINDVGKRMGDLRTLPKSDGLWARAIAGQSEYKSIHNTYQTLQIGADKRIGDYYLGGTVNYTDGDGKLDNGSSDDKNISFGLYGGWISEDGQYVDVIVKRHRLDTDYNINYLGGATGSGSYDTWGTSASVEYGWRFGLGQSGYYLEPQAELMIGHLNSVNYTNHTSLGDVHVKQDGIKTTVGRLGIAGGWVTPDKTGSLYAKASVLHDWEGDAVTRVSKAGNSRSYTEEMGGTWGEFALGGTWNINKSLAAYGEVETTAGSPVRTTYQVSAGMRYSF